jgi:ABC-type amino acid transport substrate-binding protein
LSTLKGSSSEAFAKSQFPDAKLTLVSDYDEAIEMLRKGQIQAMVADFSECTFASFKHPEDRFMVMRDLLTTERIGVALSPSDPLLMNLMTNLFKEFEENGVFIQLENDWFVDSHWIDQVDN